MCKRIIYSVVLYLLLQSFSLSLAVACDDKYPPSPQGVVQAYLSEDFRRAANYWERVSRYTTWSDAPGWDVTVIVSGFRITGHTETLGDADVEVEYAQATDYSYDEIGPVLGKSSAVEKVNFHLVRPRGCWKIETPQSPPHLDAKYIVDDLISAAAEGKATTREIETLKALKFYYKR